MTKERAIEILSRYTTIPGDGFTYTEICAAIDMAIDALRGPCGRKAQPTDAEKLAYTE